MVYQTVKSLYILRLFPTQAEMEREVDAESGRRKTETDRETESEPQRTEEGSIERQTKGTGKGKKAHSDTRSGKRR